MKRALFWIGINLLIMCGIAFILFMGLDVWMRRYTRYMENVIVPSVIGKNIDSAIALLKENKFNPVLYDSAYNDIYPPRAVINQDPPPGTITKEGRNVFLTVNTSTPRKVVFPDITGQSIRNATLQLNSLNLMVDTVIYRPYFCVDCVIEAYVRDRKISPGDLLPVYSRITIIAGTIDTSLTMVPALIGMSLKNAIDTLNSLSLFPGAILSLEGDTVMGDTSLWWVVSQQPQPGTQIPRGSFLDLFVTKRLTHAADTHAHKK